MHDPGGSEAAARGRSREGAQRGDPRPDGRDCVRRPGPHPRPGHARRDASDHPDPTEPRVAGGAILMPPDTGCSLDADAALTGAGAASMVAVGPPLQESVRPDGPRAMEPWV